MTSRQKAYRQSDMVVRDKVRTPRLPYCADPGCLIVTQNLDCDGGVLLVHSPPDFGEPGDGDRSSLPLLDLRSRNDTGTGKDPV